MKKFLVWLCLSLLLLSFLSGCHLSRSGTTAEAPGAVLAAPQNSFSVMGLLRRIFPFFKSDALSPETMIQETLPEYGNTVGSLCYEAQLPIINAQGETGQIIIPTQTDTVTVINFWGTWCTPCVNELPYFDQLATEYGEDVTVVAIHSAMMREIAPDYIAESYPNSPIFFSWDSGTNGDYYTMLGGRGTYPYTLVLDKNGIITEVFFSSVTYEDLKTAVAEAMN